MPIALLLGLLIAPGALAAEEVSFSDKVSRAEKTLTGHDVPDLSVEERLQKMEAAMFGKHKSGSFKKRLDHINEMLGVGESHKAEVPAAKTEPATINESTAATKVEPAPKSEEPVAAAPAEPVKKVETPPPLAPERKLQSIKSPLETQDPFQRFEAPSAALNNEKIRQLLRAGLQKFSQGDNVEAQSLFNQVLDKDPSNVDALYNLGVISERRGDLQSALNNYQAASSIKRDDAELKEAVVSVRHQIAKKQGNVLVGSANANTFAGQSGLPMMGVNGNPSGYQVNVSGQGNPPILSVQSNGGAPVMPVRNRSLGRSAFGTIFSIGAGVALRGSGLHCPMCRIIRGF